MVGEWVRSHRTTTRLKEPSVARSLRSFIPFDLSHSPCRRHPQPASPVQTWMEIYCTYTLIRQRRQWRLILLQNNCLLHTIPRANSFQTVSWIEIEFFAQPIDAWQTKGAQQKQCQPRATTAVGVRIEERAGRVKSKRCRKLLSRQIEDYIETIKWRWIDEQLLDMPVFFSVLAQRHIDNVYVHRVSNPFMVHKSPPLWGIHSMSSLRSQTQFIVFLEILSSHFAH